MTTHDERIGRVRLEFARLDEETVQAGAALADTTNRIRAIRTAREYHRPADESQLPALLALAATQEQALARLSARRDESRRLLRSLEGGEAAARRKRSAGPGRFR